MEILLNFFWLLIALAAFVCWWPRLSSCNAQARGNLRALRPLLALVFALAVLFPAISVTDDLHPALYVVEDASSSRRSIVAGSGYHQQSNLGWPLSPPAISTAPLAVFRYDRVEV